MALKRTPLQWLVIASLVVVTGLCFVHPEALISPGALSPGHAALADNCFACHSPWRGASTTRCVQCHVVADIGLRTTKGAPVAPGRVAVSFHQQLTEHDCIACHGDHAGSNLSLAQHRRFSHGLLRVGIREQCRSCHQLPGDRLHAMVRGECRQCHGTEAWKPATFEHEKLFALDKEHNVGCDTCHVGGNFKAYTCYGCHEHERGRVLAQHREEGIRDLDQCARCHRSANGEHEGKGGEDD
jgi:hypothetical protein